MSAKPHLIDLPTGDLIDVDNLTGIAKTERGVMLTGPEGRPIRFLAVPDADTRELYRDELVRVAMDLQNGLRTEPKWA
jgi:hypothetical protein